MREASICWILRLDLGEDLLQGIDVALEHVDVRGVVVDRGLELGPPKIELELDRLDSPARHRRQVSPESAPDLNAGKGFQNRKGQPPVPHAAHAVPDRSEDCRCRIERPDESRLAADEVELSLVVGGARSDEGLNRDRPVLRRLRLSARHVDAWAVHDISVPSMTVFSRSERVITPILFPESSAMTMGASRSMADSISTLRLSSAPKLGRSPASAPNSRS